jgi:hypothetical protein
MVINKVFNIFVRNEMTYQDSKWPEGRNMDHQLLFGPSVSSPVNMVTLSKTPKHHLNHLIHIAHHSGHNAKLTLYFH